MSENLEFLSTLRSPLLRKRDFSRLVRVLSDCDPREVAIFDAIATMMTIQRTIVADGEKVVARQGELVAD